LTVHEGQVHRALWLWAEGYITKESHDAAKVTKSSSILKAHGPDGRSTKLTNFSKEQWDEISDLHVRDAWSIEQEKLRVIQRDIELAVDTIRDRKARKRKASGSDTTRVVKKGRGSAYERRIASSDSDIWCVCILGGIHYESSNRLPLLDLGAVIFFKDYHRDCVESHSYGLYAIPRARVLLPMNG
jgi:hypothetical protein